ncbi:MAG TPA: hypothetical protein VF442_10270 [Sphingobium sp.]
MTLPILAAGHKVLSSEWDTILSFAAPLIIQKPSDESLSSTTVLQDDDHLTLTVLANASYLMQAQLLYHGGTVGGLKLGWSGPSGATLLWTTGGAALGRGANAANTYFGGNGLGGSDILGTDGTGGIDMFATPHGTLVTSSTPGALTLRWAQGTSDSATTTVKAGSVLMLQRIS